MATHDEKQALLNPILPPYQEGTPQGYQPGPQVRYTNTTMDKHDNVTLVSTQPMPPAYVSGQSGNTNQEHLTLPIIAIVLSVIQLSVCMSLGNLIAAGCLIPGFICAIVGLTSPPAKAKRMGLWSIVFNTVHFVIWIALLVVLTIVLTVVFTAEDNQ
jgi:hypothetical protein